MFGFPKVQRQEISQYKANFLRSVTLQFLFNPCESIVEDKEFIYERFKESLPRISNKNTQGLEISFNDSSKTPVFKPLTSSDKGLEFKSLDGNKVLEVSENKIDLTIRGSVYKNFDSLNEDINAIIDIINNSNIKIINRVAIRKLNIIEFNTGGVKTPPLEIVKLILNPNLLNGILLFPKSEKIFQNINTVNFIDGINRLNFIYGLIRKDDTANAGQILIDIDLFKEGALISNEIKTSLIEINEEIFNIFDWSICENAKALLKQKNV